MENTSAGQEHQNLVIGDARPVIHGLYVVKETYNLPLIEEGDGRKCRSAQCILYQRVQSILGIERRGRAEKRVLLATVNGIADDGRAASRSTNFSVMPRIF